MTTRAEWGWGNGLSCSFPQKGMFFKIKTCILHKLTPLPTTFMLILTAGQGETPLLHPTPTHTHFDATEGVQPSPLAFRRNREVLHPPLPIST